MAKLLNILLLDDHAILLDGLEAVLKAEPGLHIAAKLSDTNLGLAYIKNGGIDVVITDYAMPGMNGADFIGRAREITPDIKMIMLSMHDEPDIIRTVMAAGVDGYVLKKYAQQELIHALHTVTSGRQYWSREISQAMIHIGSQQNNSELTEREKEVLRLLVAELSTREIAERLFISERTVDTHRKNLLRKTKVTNTVGLVKYAYRNKLV